jgi:predicted HTH transcriptional regulator
MDAASMPTPRQVYDNPTAYWSFLTAERDIDFEGQHFERKEAGRAGQHGTVSKGDLKRLRHEEIAPTISAFANSNRDGGLLVLGVASDGSVAGLQHLDESQRNIVATVHDILRGHSAIGRFHPCRNVNGREDHICFIYVPYAERSLCETPGDGKAWERVGLHDRPVSPDRRDVLRREKGIVDFERLPVCALSVDDLDQGVLQEYRGGALADSTFDRSDEDVLYAAGALANGPTVGREVNAAGALFFMANPQRVLPWARIRLLRYGFPLAQRFQGGLPDFDRELSGPITAQIRSFRAFVRDSGFFKTYQRRRPEGGFGDEPELPEIALDEAIVNAVAHRDYAIQVPIVCEKYTDAFVVRSPGVVRQPNQDVPPTFTLADRTLESLPRNPFLMR